MSGGGNVWLFDHAEIAGGGQGLGLRLAQALAERGRRAQIGCHPNSPLARQAEAAGIEVMDIEFPGLAPWRGAAIARAINRLRRLLRRLGPDSLVVGNHPRVHAYLYAAGRQLDSSPLIVNLAHEQDSARRATLRFVYRRVGALLVVGSNATSEYRARLPGAPITEMNNFLPVEYFEAAARMRRCSAPEDPPELGVLARLIPEKGVLELVEELGSSDVRRGWSRLMIGGDLQDAAYTQQVNRRIAELGLDNRVTLLGRVEDVPALLCSIDTLLVPSTGYEGQPTVILEALAHGVSVVMRAPLHSSDYERLPVAPYESTASLAAALRTPPAESAPTEELVRRFGPGQAIASLDQAAELATARL